MSLPVVVGVVAADLLAVAALTVAAVRLTARRVATLADALTAEKSLLAGVISAIPHLVYWKDPEGRYSGANDAFTRWYGASAARLVGRTDAEISAGGTLGDVLAEIEAEVLASRLPVIDRRVVVLSPQGHPASLLLNVLPQPGPSPSPGGLIGVAADVSHVSELERQLAQTHRLESVGQLAAGIAHEINTPIQFVSDNIRFVAESFAGLLPALERLAAAEGDAPRTPGPAGADVGPAVGAGIESGVDLALIVAEAPAALAESIEGLDRIAQIVRAMKDFSHPGQVRAEADLNRAVESTVQVCRNEWKYDATVELDLDPQLGLVACHEGDLKQVILNLVVNAAHAVQERRSGLGAGAPLGVVRVSTRRLTSSVQITVTDDGIGMDADTQQRIFDPFFTTKGVGKGTGQGLSLARTVVASHEGRLTVSSAPGEGATFTVSLPTTGYPDLDPASTD